MGTITTTDHYADDLAAVIAHLDVSDAVHIGHSTGGGEVVRYIARHGQSRVAKAVLISSGWRGLSRLGRFASHRCGLLEERT